MVISVSPSLPPSHSLSLSPLLILPCPPRAQDSFCRLPLSPCTHLPRRALSSASYSRIFVLLARSVKHTRHGISPIPSFLSSGFPLVSALLLPLLFFSLDSLSLSLTLSFFSLTLFQLVRAPLPLLLFPLLICFPLPVGNCALSLLPSRRYSLVCTCRCSPLHGSAFFAHLLFLLLTASLPPAPFYFTF